MKSIRELLGQEPRWSQPHALKEEYELRIGEELAATLQFRSVFGSLGTAESADGRWTFKRIGFWQTRATVRAIDSDQDIAVFELRTWKHGGTLQLADGRRFQADTNFWMTKFEFRSEDGEALLKFSRISGVLHHSSLVEVGQSRHLVEMPWLVMFGWYLTIMMHRDAAAASAAGGTGGAG